MMTENKDHRRWSERCLLTRRDHIKKTFSKSLAAHPLNIKFPFFSFEPSNQKLQTNSFSTSKTQRGKFEQDGTLMANFYIAEDDKVQFTVRI